MHVRVCTRGRQASERARARAGPEVEGLQRGEVRRGGGEVRSAVRTDGVGTAPAAGSQ